MHSPFLEEKSSSFIPSSICHPQPISLSFSHSFFSVEIVRPHTLRGKQVQSILFFFKFVLYLFLSIWRETRWQPVHLVGSIGTPRLPRWSGFSLSAFQAYSPSIFLFFLNVIVKCSSEMNLNMCTLTEGIHLVIYFLLPVLCGLFIVSLFSSLV